jgi:hypothetical protein
LHFVPGSDNLAKVTYTGGRKPKGLNKIDKLAKITYTGWRKPKGLNKIDKLAKVTYTELPFFFPPV